MNKVLIRQLGLQHYQDTHDAMVGFTGRRGPETEDEIWCLEHEPVFTLGMAGKTEHLLDPGAIPVRRTDRGGQVTYHGPGQLVVYPLIDLKRLGVSIKGYVNMLEQAVIDCLAGFGLDAQRRAGNAGRIPGRQQDRGPGCAGEKRMLLPRLGAEREDGLGSVPAYQSLRLSRPGGNATGGPGCRFDGR